MTDVKGDRSKRPSQQADPDMFVHLVDKNDDGIVVRGAKAHITGAALAHEIFVIPTQTMRPGEEEYAVPGQQGGRQSGGAARALLWDEHEQSVEGYAAADSYLPRNARYGVLPRLGPRARHYASLLSDDA